MLVVVVRRHVAREHLLPAMLAYTAPNRPSDAPPIVDCAVPLLTLFFNVDEGAHRIVPSAGGRRSSGNPPARPRSSA